MPSGNCAMTRSCYDEAWRELATQSMCTARNTVGLNASQIEAVSKLAPSVPWCRQHTEHGSWRIYGFKGIEFSGAVLQFMFTFSALLYIAYQRRLASAYKGAMSGSSPHINRLVLPTYRLMLYMYCCVTTIASCVHLIESAEKGMGPVNDWLCDHFTYRGQAIAVGLRWGIFHFTFEGLTFFMMQKGAGTRAFVRALKWSTMLGVCLFVIVSAAELAQIAPDGSSDYVLGQWLYLGIRAALVMFYVAVRFAPSTWFFRRPACRNYASLQLLWRASTLSSSVLELLRIDFGWCLYAAVNYLIFAGIAPLAFYAALREDSQFWRGHAKGESSHKRGSGGHSNLNLPLAGRLSLTESTASHLAETLDTIQAQNGVQLLNFAFLNMQDSQHGRLHVLGAGGTAKVYKASYQGESVAVKLVYPPELTQAEVSGFLSEAAVLADAGKHRNLVLTHGVCVMPPSIALVLEFCDRGDLNHHLASCATDGLLDNDVRQQAEMAIDCAAGVGYLHSQPIIHNDLKSFNVLVSSTGDFCRPFVAKVADLEFGQRAKAAPPSSRASRMSGWLDRTNSQTNATVQTSQTPPPIPDTVNWTAPELLSGAEEWPSTASDVWALGMVMFEIFALEIP